VDKRELIERLALAAHGQGYVDSPHVFYAGPGIHDEARYERHPFKTCPAPDCVAARSLPDTPSLRDAVLAEGERLRTAHGESDDCDECLVVQRLVDMALRAAATGGTGGAAQPAIRFGATEQRPAIDLTGR
jgi:hypothetical protein